MFSSVFKRDGWKCRSCWFRQNLHAHHVIHRSQQGEDKMNNLITLCAQCHRAYHDGKLDIQIKETLENDVSVVFHRKDGWKPA